MGYVFAYSSSLIPIVNCILILYVAHLSIAEFLYGIFQHQACVYRSRDQYDRSHEILTDVLDLETTREVRYC